MGVGVGGITTCSRERARKCDDAWRCSASVRWNRNSSGGAPSTHGASSAHAKYGESPYVHVNARFHETYL